MELLQAFKRRLLLLGRLVLTPELALGHPARRGVLLLLLICRQLCFVAAAVGAVAAILTGTTAAA